MSRIGRKAIVIPDGVDIKMDGGSITVKGPRGELSMALTHKLGYELENGTLTVTRPSDDKEYRSLHGLTRTLINNMVVGVTEGYKKELEIIGTGYTASKQGSVTTIKIGYSHPVEVADTDDITIELHTDKKFAVQGIDKQKVGQFAAEVRGIRPPEPYHGKGIRYVGEHVIHKEGKAGKAAK